MSDDTRLPFRPFPTTRWSSVARAGSDEAEATRAALDRLLGRYLPALKAHLVYQRRMTPDRADDLLQGFVSEKILQKNLIARADRDRGKFRTFMLYALDNYVVSAMRRASAKKRSPAEGATVGLDEHLDHVAADEGPSDVFDVAWARQVLAEVLSRMESECADSGRSDIWGVFECRVLKPMLDRGDPLPYEELVERFGLKSPAQASNVLVTAKRMFARILQSVVAEYAGDDVEAEISELRLILSRAGAG